MRMMQTITPANVAGASSEFRCSTPDLALKPGAAPGEDPATWAQKPTKFIYKVYSNSTQAVNQQGDETGGKFSASEDSGPQPPAPPGVLPSAKFNRSPTPGRAGGFRRFHIPQTPSAKLKLGAAIERV